MKESQVWAHKKMINSTKPTSNQIKLNKTEKKKKHDLSNKTHVESI